jgi:hypothetical protein
MSNPTTPFSWQMPTATDLVTDLPADFEVFGQAVATSMADLLGGTTGQVLSKTTNADMDFTWIANDQGDITGVTAGVGITVANPTGPVPTVTNDMATTITAAGDIVIGTGSGTYDNLPIGTTNQVLTADTTVLPYKVKWAAPAAVSGMTLITRSSFSNVASVTYDSVFSASYGSYLVVIESITSATGGDDLLVKLRYGSTTETASYRAASIVTVYNSATITTVLNSAVSSFMLADTMGSASEPCRGHMIIPNVGAAGVFGASGQLSNVGDSRFYNFNLTNFQSRTYTGLLFQSSSSNITGTIAIYGMAV